MTFVCFLLKYSSLAIPLSKKRFTKRNRLRPDRGNSVVNSLKILIWLFFFILNYFSHLMRDLFHIFRDSRQFCNQVCALATICVNIWMIRTRAIERQPNDLYNNTRNIQFLVNLSTLKNDLCIEHLLNKMNAIFIIRFNLVDKIQSQQNNWQEWLCKWICCCKIISLNWIYEF